MPKPGAINEPQGLTLRCRANFVRVNDQLSFLIEHGRAGPPVEVSLAYTGQAWGVTPRAQRSSGPPRDQPYLTLRADGTAANSGASTSRSATATRLTTCAARTALSSQRPARWRWTSCSCSGTRPLPRPTQAVLCNPIQDAGVGPTRTRRTAPTKKLTERPVKRPTCSRAASAGGCVYQSKGSTGCRCSTRWSKSTA